MTLAAASLGCAATDVDQPLISSDAAAAAVSRTLNVRLTEATTADVPALSDLVARYSGGDRENPVLLLVFDSVASPRQVAGGHAHFRGGLSAVTERNVVVMLGGRGLPRRRAAVTGALRSAAAR